MALTFAESLLHCSHVASLICTFIFNGILCLCLYSEYRCELRMYRKVLYIQCCSDCIASVCYYFAAVRFVMIDGIFFVISTGSWFESGVFTVLGVNMPSKYVSLFLYPFPTGLAIIFVPLNFYFRYRQVVMSKPLSNHFIFAYIIFAFIATMTMSIIGVIQCIDSSGYHTETSDNVLLEYNAVTSKDPNKLLPYVVFPPYSGYTWIYAAYCALVIAGSYAALIWIMAQVVAKLKANRYLMSDRTVGLHKQINKVLLIQVSLKK